MTRRGIQYTSSPLLASRTPVWRSKFVVGAIALGFTGLVARAAYIQVYANDFFQRQGEVRFARTIDLPADRGRILDRNGLILGSSVPAPSIWAIPEDVEINASQRQQLAKLLEMPPAEISKKLADEDKTFVWLKRQVDESVAQQVAALGLKGIYQRKEYKRQYPEGEAAQANEFQARLQGQERHFEQVAQAFGAYGECVSDPADVPQAIARCLQALQDGRAAVLNVQIGLQ